MAAVLESQVALVVGDQLMSPEQYEAHQSARLDELHNTFTRMRDRWVQHRALSGVEKRWRRAAQLYWGEHTESTGEFENTLKNGPPARKVTDGQRSRIVVNIVRPKVDQATARICEILLPTDDKNWGIKPTPVPEVGDMSSDQRKTVDPATGQPTGLTAAEEAQFVVQAAKACAEDMERAIDDPLTECNYNGESRKLVENGVRLGTGIMYGPFPARQTSKIWRPQPDGTQGITLNESIVPASMALDPWDTFFDPACGNNHQRGSGFFVRRRVTRKEVRALVGLPGYDADAIREVLRTEPKRIRVAEQRVLRETIEDDSYEMWTYHGDVDEDDMLTLTERGGDPLEVDFGVLVIVNDKIIGAMPSWVSDHTLPIDVWCWRKADDSPYGFGLCDELEAQQRVVNASWRQLMDNARVAVGGQIVAKKGKIEPANRSAEITPLKLWYAKDDVEDVRDAFQVFEFNSHAEELLAIAQAAMQFADVESSMPQLLGGEKGTAPETVGGMVMLYNSASGVLRQRVKIWDDEITKPHIGRYYDWMMANNPDPKIKGDYEVDARGSTALIERDIQNQALLNLANITNNPRYQPYLKVDQELRTILKAFRVDPEQLMKTEDQVKQDQQNAPQQPADPRIEAAKMNLQARQEDIADRKEQRQFDAQAHADEAGLKREELNVLRQREQGEYEVAMTAAEIDRDVALTKLGSEQQLTREEIAAKERMNLLKIDTERQLFVGEARLKTALGSGI